MWRPLATSVGEENKAFLIRVWKPLPSRCVLKTLRGNTKGKTQRGQYLLAVSLGCYKWYQSQTTGGGKRGRWAPKGGGLWDPTSVGEKNKAFLLRVWKPLFSRHVLKTLRGSPKGKTQRGQYLLTVGLGCYKGTLRTSLELYSWYSLVLFTCS